MATYPSRRSERLFVQETLPKDDPKTTEELQFGIGIDLGTRYSNVAVYERSPPGSSNQITLMRNLPAIKDEHHGDGRYTTADVVTEVFWKPGMDGQPDFKAWGWQALNQAGRAENQGFLFGNLKYDLIREPVVDQGSLKEHRDRLVYFFTSLLEHAKEYFRKPHPKDPSRARFNLDRTQYFVLTVPTKFDEDKADLILQCLREAVRISKIFPNRHQLNKKTGHFIIMDEAEAAAEFYFERIADAKLGDPLLIADIGGGTADILFGRVVTSAPRRWQRVSAASCPTGSCRLDEGFIDIVRNECVKRDPSEQGALAYARQQCRDRFENPKSRVTLEDLQIEDKPCSVFFDVQLSHKSGDNVAFTNKTLRDLFMPVLRELFQVMVDIIDEAGEDYGLANMKLRIVLVGGFSQNYALRDFLHRELHKRYANANFKIIMSLDEHCDSTAVVQGGLIRAANVGVGSDTEVFAVSYGRPCWMVEGHIWAEHVPQSALQNPSLWSDELDGKRYMRIIQWFWLKGDSKPRGGKYVIPNIQHRLEMRADGKCIMKEPIMIARKRMTSFLPYEDPENQKYAEECFSIEWDASTWISSNLVTRYYEGTETAVPRGVTTRRNTYLAAEYDVEITVKGLGITALARCLGSEGKPGAVIKAEVMRVAAPMTTAQ